MNNEEVLANELHYTINGETPGIVSGFVDGIMEIS